MVATSAAERLVVETLKGNAWQVTRNGIRPLAALAPTPARFYQRSICRLSLGAGDQHEGSSSSAFLGQVLRPWR
ncbi:hypothetical protein SBA3_140008 [Candidatus Sulfopaludibacter sp. SbA3]|nr:hypothetical protein SBA3_140008 [Candidatus Sulfopaludibacter sp. SbA3]